MTVLGRLIALYPSLILSLTVATLGWFVYSPALLQPVLFLVILYIILPITLRLHQQVFPLRERLARLSDRTYSPWWGMHQIQVLYIAIPQLEAVLRLVPGLYSQWLRLWGSKVGRRVYWTPNVEIADRSLMEIGDRVIFGHHTKFFAHVIKPKGNALLLYIRTVKIGNDVFIGAGSRVGPGVVIADGAYLPVLTDLYVNQIVTAQPCSE